MANQQLLVPSSSQSGLETLLIFVPRNKKNPSWKLDQKTQVENGIKIPDENKIFFYSNQMQLFQGDGETRNVEKDGRTRKGMGQQGWVGHIANH